MNKKRQIIKVLINYLLHIHAVSLFVVQTSSSWYKISIHFVINESFQRQREVFLFITTAFSFAAKIRVRVNIYRCSPWLCVRGKTGPRVYFLSVSYRTNEIKSVSDILENYLGAIKQYRFQFLYFKRHFVNIKMGIGNLWVVPRCGRQQIIDYWWLMNNQQQLMLGIILNGYKIKTNYFIALCPFMN